MKALSFFSMDSILAAKELVTHVTSRKNPADTMVDIIQAIQQCDEKKTTLPRYVIFEPDEVPETAGEISKKSERASCQV